MGNGLDLLRENQDSRGSVVSRDSTCPAHTYQRLGCPAVQSGVASWHHRHTPTARSTGQGLSHAGAVGTRGAGAWGSSTVVCSPPCHQCRCSCTCSWAERTRHCCSVRHPGHSPHRPPLQNTGGRHVRPGSVGSVPGYFCAVFPLCKTSCQEITHVWMEGLSHIFAPQGQRLGHVKGRGARVW